MSRRAVWPPSAPRQTTCRPQLRRGRRGRCRRQWRRAAASQTPRAPPQTCTGPYWQGDAAPSPQRARPPTAMGWAKEWQRLDCTAVVVSVVSTNTARQVCAPPLHVWPRLHGHILRAKLMVAAQQKNLVRVHELEREEEDDAFKLVRTAVHKIAVENVPVHAIRRRHNAQFTPTRDFMQRTECSVRRHPCASACRRRQRRRAGRAPVHSWSGKELRELKPRRCQWTRHLAVYIAKDLDGRRNLRDHRLRLEHAPAASRELHDHAGVGSLPQGGRAGGARGGKGRVVQRQQPRRG